MAAKKLPLSLSGSLGYNYRLLDGPGEQKTASHQGFGSLYANTYLWRPWFATSDAAMTLSYDKSKFEDNDSANGTGSIDSDNTIMTGVLNLNVLPKSRTPFNFRYAVTDTRVDNNKVSGDVIVAFAGGDSRSYKLGLRQAFISEAGHRLLLTYDNNTYKTDTKGDYDDDTASLELDVRGKKQRLTLSGKYQEAKRSISDEKNENIVLDAAHYYYPTRSLRIDTRVSDYSIDRDFNVPSNNSQSGKSKSDLRQVSSTLFWRPQNSRWTVSGGARLFDLKGENDGLSNDSENTSVTTGAFYQFNKRLRFEGNASYSSTDSNNIKNDVYRQRLGVLYQSDLKQIYKFNYQWFGDAGIDNVNADSGDEQLATSRMGHNAQRSWRTSGSSVFNVNVSQALNYLYNFEEKEDQPRVEHTGTARWSQDAGGGTTFVELTMSDLRNYGDIKGDQQLVNFQANRKQQISRRSALSGNVTIQYVSTDFDGRRNDFDYTTTTGKMNYINSALFGIPRLSYLSEYFISRASEGQQVDRQEWENRLDYVIGQLTTSLSHRWYRYDNDNYQLTNVRVERQF